jgi:O-glycosyl hydrolase
MRCFHVVSDVRENSQTLAISAQQLIRGQADFDHDGECFLHSAAPRYKLSAQGNSPCGFSLCRIKRQASAARDQEKWRAEAFQISLKS